MIGGFIAAWLDMRSKPLRTLAAIAGMIAAVTAVILIDAAGIISQRASFEHLSRQSGLPVTLSITATVPQYGDDLDDLLQHSGLPAVSRSDRTQINILVDNRFTQASIQFVSPSCNRIRVVDMVAGMWPQETANSRVGHVVVTDSFARRLGYIEPGQAVGQPIYYSPKSGFDLVENNETLFVFVIDGVSTLAAGSVDDANMLLVSDASPPDWIEQGGYLVRVNPVDLPMVQELFSRKNQATGEAMFGWNRLDQSDQFAPVLKQQEVTSRIVQTIALTVGGLGVLGVGLSSVRERTRDFGLRRALGASPAKVFGSVLLQSFLEACLASFLAIPLSFVLLRLVARQLVLQELPLPSEVQLPLQSVAWGIGCAAIVGIIAGLMPAVVAARASVAQSLHG